LRRAHHLFREQGGGHAALCPPYNSRFLIARKSNLLKRINVIWGVQIARKKYFLSRLRPNQIIIRPVPPLSEGRFAIVTDVRRDAVDADAPLTNGAEADGEVVWS
jgi:hypothetical protein